MICNSIRLRLLVVAVTSILVTIAVAGASLVVFFERQVLRYVEQDLNIHWTELATAFGTEGEAGIGQKLTDPRYHQPYGGAYWQVSEGGRPIMRSRSLWDKELPLAGSREETDRDKAFEIDGPDGSELYVIEREVTVDGDQGPRRVSLSVALDHGQVVELRQAFGWDVTRVLIPIAAVLVLFAWLQLSLGLRPLRAVGQELSAVQTGQIRRMMQRFPVEVEPLAESINRLLDRQEDLVRKARDRAGALAHGLKTPLTILRGEVRRLEQAGLQDVAGCMQEQLQLIYTHVEREVARARTSGASVGCGAYTQVDETIARLLRLMQHMPRGERLMWEADIPADLAVDMDPHDFGEVMGNLLDNARKWAKTQVTVQIERLGDKARISVEDDGPGFAGHARGERPERGVPARSDPDSSGLGLGIVEDILAEYGTGVDIEGNGRCRIVFDIPLSRPGQLPMPSKSAVPMRS
ncbi:sensor histidine kinase [Microvirga mediterraneensis]|uniref:histidine kinase n=1 Tax=Microvirga mediterraneensis TaxID=2754695 RepID=A0A838BVB2_9HYPH|nr:HAMP domain-containing sensor histidine kinase [Microvirga mediterraneensis]MBA1158823.1 HAMP domain-containing histidine kinase [Microvirga mediterraneensis]